MATFWAFDPRDGSRDFAVWVDDVREYDHIMERGYALLNGVKARPVVGPDTCARAIGRRGESFMRFFLDEPFVAPAGSRYAIEGHRPAEGADDVVPDPPKHLRAAA